MSLTHHWESRRGSQTSQARRGAPETSRAWGFFPRKSPDPSGQQWEMVNKLPTFPPHITSRRRLGDRQNPFPRGRAAAHVDILPPTVTTDRKAPGASISAPPPDSPPPGFTLAGQKDRRGLPQAPRGLPLFRAFFPSPGIFPYTRPLHDELG